MPDDLDTGRKTPPEEHEWEGIWRALENGNKSWLIARPFHAVVTNWKALVFAGALILTLNGKQILEILQAYLGKLP